MLFNYNFFVISCLSELKHDELILSELKHGELNHDFLDKFLISLLGNNLTMFCLLLSLALKKKIQNFQFHVIIIFPANTKVKD